MEVKWDVDLDKLKAYLPRLKEIARQGKQLEHIFRNPASNKTGYTYAELSEKHEDMKRHLHSEIQHKLGGDNAYYAFAEIIPKLEEKM